MKVLITGIDGYSGWPLALHLLARGHDVSGIDNLVTRKRVKEVGSWSATPIPTMPRRLAAVQELTGKQIRFYKGDLCDYDFVRGVLEKERPDSIVHLAEQRSAPYPMIDVDHAVTTQVENLTGTLHLVYAIKEACPDAHLVKMGTMGEYGTPNTDIPEGFFEVEFHGRKDYLPYPRNAGSCVPLEQGLRFGGRDARRQDLQPARDRRDAGRHLRRPHRGDHRRPPAHPVRL